MDSLPVDAIRRSDADASWRALRAMAAIGGVGNAAYFAVGWFSQSAFATLSVGGVALGACIAAGVRIGRHEQLRTRRIAELAFAGLGVFVGIWLLITMVFAVILFSGGPIGPGDG